MGFLLKLLTDRWRHKNSSSAGKEVRGIHACFDFSDLWTDLGEIIVVEG